MNEITLIIVFFASIFILGGAIAILRFPDSVSRIHSTGKAGAFTAILLMLALFIEKPSLGAFFQLSMISVLIYFTSSQAAQLIAKAGLTSSFDQKTNAK
jgi:multicomponent Na+:H+ antiporter subunit G